MQTFHLGIFLHTTKRLLGLQRKSFVSSNTKRGGVRLRIEGGSSDHLQNDQRNGPYKDRIAVYAAKGGPIQ